MEGHVRGYTICARVTRSRVYVTALPTNDRIATNAIAGVSITGKEMT